MSGGVPRQVAWFAALCAAAGLAAPACRPGEAPAPARRALRYDGATSISNRILASALPELAGRTGLEVQVARSGTGKGLKALWDGQVEVAGVSRALTPEERGRRPSVAIIGYDALAAWVHRTNPVKGLTHQQLKDLFTGRITSWKQLGGPDLPVVTCTERRDSERATLEAFRQLALDGADYGPGRELEDPADCLALVASSPGAVAPASIAYALPGVRPLPVDGVAPVAANVRNATYPLTRPLLLVTREPPHGDLRTFVDFMVSPEGQAFVAGAGFVAAR